LSNPTETIKTEFGYFANQKNRGVVISVVCCLLVAAIIFASFGFSRRLETEYENRAILEVRYEARLFEAYTKSLLQAFDQVLLQLREEILEDGLHPDLAAWSVRRSVLRKPLFQIGVIGADGRLAATTEGASSIGVDLSDREHFRVHLDSNDDRMFISKPLVGRATGRSSLNISRPIRRSDGTFIGATVVSVDPAHFSGFLSVLDERHIAMVSLIGIDGIIRARAPVANGHNIIGMSIVGLDLEQFVLDAREGAFRSYSRLDQMELVSAFRHLDDFGMIVLVGKSSDAIFDDFYRQRRLYLGFGFVAALFVVGVGVSFETLSRFQDQARVSRAVAALQDRQFKELVGIMDGCGAVLVQTDTEGTIVACNSAFAAMVGRADRTEFLGRSIVSIVESGGLKAGQIDHFSGVRLATTYPVQFESSFAPICQNKPRIDIMWSWTQSRIGDGVEGRFVGVGIDNTDLRAKEMMLIQSSKLASLGRLAATLNHEIVQPLNVARLGLGNLKSLIEKGAPKEDLLVRADKTIDNIQRTGKILARFRSLVRQDRDFVENVQLSDAIYAATGMYEEQFRIDGIKLIVETDVDCELECSRIELEQVFVNLLANCYDAILRSRSHEKSVPGSSERSPDIVRVRIELDRGAQKIARILVEDSGGGIPAGITEQIFQPFFTTRSSNGGTGLGLAICRATIESLNGTIKVSNAGRGALFVVSLPIRTAAVLAPDSA